MQMEHKTSLARSDLERILVDETAEPKALPLSLFEDITGGFSADREIGRGGFAVVYKGILGSRVVAVKKLSMAGLDEIKFLRELECLLRVKHKNTVRCLGYCADTQGNMQKENGKFIMAGVHHQLLCFEYISKGSLDKYITDASSGLNWHKRWKVIEGISYGLQYLHEYSNELIIHLDLKPANILLDANMLPKIADFGLSRIFGQNKTIHTANTTGTFGYMPKETLLKGIITPKSDIFSLGVIIMEVITGHRDYPDNIESSKCFLEQELEKWRHRLQEELGYTSLDKDCQQIERCLQIGLICVNDDRTKRPTMKKIIDMLQGLESTDWYIGNKENATEKLLYDEEQLKESRDAEQLEETSPLFSLEVAVAELDASGSGIGLGVPPFKVDSQETSNVYGRFMERPQSGPVIAQSEAPEYNLIFYMHQTISGPNHNQVNIADPKLPRLFGYTNVHDYPVYDGLGPTATIVARAQGLHTETSMNWNDWLHWSSIVFSDTRFRGSSIMAFGNQGDQGEWAIVGGTGLFTFAKGTITIYRIPREDDSSNIKEICIRLFCCTPRTAPTKTKMMHFEKVDSITASNSSKSPMVNSQTSYVTSTESEYDFIAYMNQTIGGPNHNQVNILDPKQPMMFGYTNVHDYQIYDSLGPTAKIIARAQGLHTETSMNTNSWFHWSSIVFIDERFQGSSLKAIGNQTTVGEWAIIGGTGVFTFAQGTISIKRIEDNGSSNIKEIHIHAFCEKYQTTPTITEHFRDRSKMIGTSAASNDRIPIMTSAQSGPVTPQSQATEYNFRLYMHQEIDGENKNQVNIADPEQPMMFGYTNVHDYPIYDRLGLNAKIVARAQGLHTETDMNSDNWFHWSSIIFCYERFQGSSLKAVGNQGKVEGEWVIVGGTGLFTCAQGTISIFRVQDKGSSNIKEIRINAYCYKP